MKTAVFLMISYVLLCRVRFKISTFCMIWKDTTFSVISILNFFKSNGSQTFIKTKIILKSNTIVFDPFNLFVFVNICLLVLFKKFNMDITEKMVSFQIIQNVINVKTTLVRLFTSGGKSHYSLIIKAHFESWPHLLSTKSKVKHIGKILLI